VEEKSDWGRGERDEPKEAKVDKEPIGKKEERGREEERDEVGEPGEAQEITHLWEMRGRREKRRDGEDRQETEPTRLRKMYRMRRKWSRWSSRTSTLCEQETDQSQDRTLNLHDAIDKQLWARNVSAEDICGGMSLQEDEEWDMRRLPQDW
jgi:hypothetical protein